MCCALGAWVGHFSPQNSEQKKKSVFLRFRSVQCPTDFKRMAGADVKRAEAWVSCATELSPRLVIHAQITSLPVQSGPFSQHLPDAKAPVSAPTTSETCLRPRSRRRRKECLPQQGNNFSAAFTVRLPLNRANYSRWAPARSLTSGRIMQHTCSGWRCRLRSGHCCTTTG